MKSATLKASLATTVLALGTLGSVAFAEPHPTAELIIEGDLHLTTRAPTPEHMGGILPEIMSGWLFRTDETRALQMDDFDNPGMLAVDRGLEEWDRVAAATDQSCASCHGGPEAMAGVRAVMPKVNADGTLWSLENYINDCRTTRMEQEPWGWNSDAMKGMTSMISLQSRGMPVDVAIDGDAAPYWEQGKELYFTRFGQLELSCSNCHEDNWGNYIRADHLSQGMSNGFPTYRLRNADIVPLHQRFRGCIRDTRAESFREGSPEFIALELYVASRGNGLSVEGVAVRQ